MPLDPDSRELARAWLDRAKGSLARAKQPKPEEGFWEDLCFDAQQAAEKAVKGVLVLHALDFPRTHQIGELLGILRRAGHRPPEELTRADRISEYAVSTRYPKAARPVDEVEYKQAVQLAEQVVRWAETVVNA